MTDKTDALVARLRMHARDCVSAADMDTDTVLSAAQIDDMADALNKAAEALAAPAEGGQGVVVVTRAGNSTGPIVAVTRQDKEGRILSVIAEAAQPAASVDVEGLRALANQIERWADLLPVGSGDACEWAASIRRLIDSAGGAKGEKPFKAPGAWFPLTVLGQPMREFAPGKWEHASWPSEAPQPAEGDGAVGVVTIMGGRSEATLFVADLPDGTKLYTRPSAAAAVPDAERVAEIARLRERAEKLEAALRDVLDRDAKGEFECGCININRSTEREYESGRCPHQRALATLADGEAVSA